MVQGCGEGGEAALRYVARFCMVTIPPGKHPKREEERKGGLVLGLFFTGWMLEGDKGGGEEEGGQCRM
jgi:hypothetical protein